MQTDLSLPPPIENLRIKFQDPEFSNLPPAGQFLRRIARKTYYDK